MLKAHQGRIKEDGRFVPDSMIKLPINRRAIIIWEEESNETDERLSLEQCEVVRMFLSETEKIIKEGFDLEEKVSFDRFENGEYRLELKERL